MDTRRSFQLREYFEKLPWGNLKPKVLKRMERDSKSHAQRRRHMGVLFNRSRVPLLTQMMLEEISNFEKLLAKLSQGKVNLVPTCRALEADIVCELQTFRSSSLF